MRKALSLFYCSFIIITAPAQQREPIDRVDSFKGNAFKVKVFSDTTTMLDPVTLDVETVISNPSPVPYKMNAMNIYREADVDKPPSITEQKLQHYILQKLGNHITSLGDGEYRLILNSIVISEQGKIAYYDYIAVERYTQTRIKDASGANTTHFRTDWKEIPQTQEKAFTTALEKIIDSAPKYTPAQAGGYPVPFSMSDDIIKQPFYIRAGKIYHNK